MLSDDLRTAAEAMRHSAEAPAADLRAGLLAYADLTEAAATRAMSLEKIIVRQCEQLQAKPIRVDIHIDEAGIAERILRGVGALPRALERTFVRRLAR